MLPAHIELGKNTEKFVSSVLSALKIPHKHNSFTDNYLYSVGRGSDIEDHISGDIFELEIKGTLYRMSVDWLKREVIGGQCKTGFYAPRFKPETKNKLLALPFKNQISKEGHELLKAHGIKVIEFGSKITGYNPDSFKYLLNQLKFLTYVIPPMSRVGSRNSYNNVITDYLDINLKPIYSYVKPVLYNDRLKLDQTNLLEYNGLEDTELNINNELEPIKNELNWNIINYNILMTEKPAARPSFSPAQSWWN